MRPWIVFVAATLASAPALAQETPQEASRRTLLDAAFNIANTGDHRRALQLGEQAAQIRMTPSLRLFLAEEHEHLSRDPDGRAHILDAAAQAEACVTEATAQPSVNNRARILRDCNALAARVAARMGRVRVTLDAMPDDGTAITLDGRELPRAIWNTAAPVAAGNVEVVARRAGMLPFRQIVAVVGGTSHDVRVTFVPEPVVVVAPPPPVLRVEPPPTTTPALRVVGYVALGLGVAASAFGVVQWVRSSTQLDEARAGTGANGEAWARYANGLRVSTGGTITVDGVCSRAANDSATDHDAVVAQDLCAQNRTTVTTAWAFGIGGAALAVAGVTMALLARSAPRVTAAPVVGAGYGGATLDVRF
ncbi:MAG: hypothetical protein U0326_23020 [Polyangiales bacterium]